VDIRAAVSYGFVNGIVAKYDSEDFGDGTNSLSCRRQPHSQ